MARQFLHFCTAGILGLGVDIASLQILTHSAGAGPYGARLLSFLAAVTTTWAYNRHYTFEPLPDEPLAREWLRYCLANALGGLVNYGTYALLVQHSPLVRHWLPLGVAAGSVAGLAFNFLASKYAVYRARAPD